jgi:hypothetical protein
MRRDMNPRADKQVFRHTADKTKKVNIISRIFRGGFRF